MARFWSVWTAATVPAATQWQAVSQSEPATVVEGRVTDFVRMPYNGPSHGTFVVAGKQFTFSEIGLKPPPTEGSITDGVYARVTFRERPINRIEILRLGYQDPEALIIARYQECAIVMTIVGVIACLRLSQIWQGLDFRRLRKPRMSHHGTRPTRRGDLTISVDRDRPEGTGPRSKWREVPKATSSLAHN